MECTGGSLSHTGSRKGAVAKATIKLVPGWSRDSPTMGASRGPESEKGSQGSARKQGRGQSQAKKDSASH